MWVGKEILWKSYFGKSYCNFCATRSQYSEKFNLFYKLIYFNWIELIIEYQMDRLDNKFGHPLGVSFKHTISSLLLTHIILYWSLFFYSTVTPTRPLIQFNSNTELVSTPQVKGKVLHETAPAPTSDAISKFWSHLHFFYQPAKKSEVPTTPTAVW